MNTVTVRNQDNAGSHFSTYEANNVEIRDGRLLVFRSGKTIAAFNVDNWSSYEIEKVARKKKEASGS